MRRIIKRFRRQPAFRVSCCVVSRIAAAAAKRKKRINVRAMHPFLTRPSPVALIINARCFQLQIERCNRHDDGGKIVKQRIDEKKNENGSIYYASFSFQNKQPENDYLAERWQIKREELKPLRIFFTLMYSHYHNCLQYLSHHLCEITAAVNDTKVKQSRVFSRIRWTENGIVRLLGYTEWAKSFFPPFFFQWNVLQRTNVRKN